MADDMFLTAQKKFVETEIKELQKKKESAGKMLDVDKKAREILVQKIIANLQYCRVKSLADLLSSQGSQQDEKGCNC